MDKRLWLLGVLVALTLLAVGVVGVRLWDTVQEKSAAPKMGVIWGSRLETPAPVPFLDADGRALTLSDFKGRIAIVNLWATWCAPCVKELPSLDRLAAREGDRLHVLAISFDREGTPVVERFFAVNGIKTLKPYADATMKAMFAWDAKGLPTTLVLDADGHEAARVIGELDWDGPEAEKLIARVRDER